MKIKKVISIVLFASAALSLILALSMPSKPEKWRHNSVYKGDASFVQMEMVQGEPHIAFSTDKGIMLVEKEGASLPLLDSFKAYLGEPRWEGKLISSSRNAGFYLSMKELNQNIVLAHQYSKLGNRKLGYTHRQNNKWITEKVDSVTGTGLEAGMYASVTHIQDRPVIFYHTAEGDKFVKAIKKRGNWSREVLDSDTGWFISSDSCGKKAFIVYSSRENKSLHKGTFTGNSDWSTEGINGRVDATTSVDADNCKFRTAYHNPETDNIVYMTANSREIVGEAKLSRLSLEYEIKPKISYYDYGEGLYYAHKNKEGWNKQLVDGNRSYAGEYNDLEVQSSTPRIAYTTGNRVIYAERSRDGYSKVRILLIALFLCLLVIGIISLKYSEYDLHSTVSKLYKRVNTKFS